MYRTIDVAMWTDPEFKKLNPTGKLVFTYLITNPHSHVSGIYYLPTQYASHETGVRRTTLDTVYDTLSGAGFASFDAENEVVWVRNMFRHQARGEKAIRAAAKQLANLHNSFLIYDFCEHYPEVEAEVDLPPRDTVSIGYPSRAPRVGSGVGAGEGSGEGSGEGEAPPNGGIPPADSKPPKKKPPHAADFRAWYAVYPKRVSPDSAFKQWKLALTRLKLEKGFSDEEAKAYLLEAVTAFAASGWGQQRQKCPTPTNWLIEGKFNDDRENWELWSKDDGKPDKTAGNIDAAASWLQRRADEGRLDV